MEFKDYYNVLGVAPKAEAKAVKTAYRKLAKKYHPDVSDHEQAEEKFKEVVEAYEVLKNAEKRAEYDELREYRARFGDSAGGFQPRSGQGSGKAGGYDENQFQSEYADFFSSIFGASQGRAQDANGAHTQYAFNQRGQDVETDLPVFLEDTLSEASKKISLRFPHRDETGRVYQSDKTLNVKIPTGVSDGERIRLKGQGGDGIGTGVKGDLYLRIRLVPHPLFDVQAHNLILTLPLAPWEAALGCKIEVPTLSGKINLSIPANSQTGQRMRVKGKGLVGRHGKGDLFAVIKVVMPAKAASDEIKQQWQTLASDAAFDPRSEWSKS